MTAQLDQYFAGERRRFELDVELDGTRFQTAVWERLREIPYGSTASYGEIADDLGEAAFPAGLEPHERARAVGAEVGRTPVPIVIPCHRVIGADGSLTGYGGGLERKRALLDLESSQLRSALSRPHNRRRPAFRRGASGVTTGRRDMYLYICGSVGGRSGSLVPFGAKLWEAVTLCRRRGTRPKSLMSRYLSAS